MRLEAPQAQPGAAQAGQSVAVPAGSEALAQLHHLRDPVEDYAFSLDDRSQAFAVIGEGSGEAKLLLDRSGRLRIGTSGEELGAWDIEAVPDQVPEIALADKPGATHRGVLRAQFNAKDDYGVREAHAIIEPLDVADGATPLYPPPEYKLDLPRQNPRDIKGLTSRNLTEHPMAGKRVRITLVATDGAGQTGKSPPQEMILPGRNFSEPLAAAIVEQRQIFSLDTRQMPLRRPPPVAIHDDGDVRGEPLETELIDERPVGVAGRDPRQQLVTRHAACPLSAST